MNLKLPKLQPDDYLNGDYEFWKNYRIILTQIIHEQEKQEKLEKTPKNIIMMAKEQGVKPTARYFGIQPSQVRYYVKKQNGDGNND